MEQVAPRPEHKERATFTAADLRAVATAVEGVIRDGVGAEDVLRAVDDLIGVHALSLWAGLDHERHLERAATLRPPVHLGRAEPRELGRALPVAGRRGRRSFVLVAWRRAAAPPFDGNERDLLDAVAPAVALALGQRPRARLATRRELLAALARAREAWPAPRSPRVALTAREERVGALVALGRSNGEVAFELGVSEHTVKQHLKSIFRKLGVRGRTELALRLARGRDG